MKKSLSVLVAGAMVSSMFASVAFAADLTTEQKLQALINAGIFDPEGTGNGFELDAKMTREQLAKILAKLMGLQELPGTSYTDVEADRWSAGFIQAVSKANPPLMDGQWEGIFNPSGTVTIEELATVAVRALNLEVKNNAEVDGEVSDWAKGYVAAAVSAGLIGELSDYTKPAIRSQLVEATYAAKEALDDAKSPNVSVVSAKATGVQKIEVTFSKAVDTTKAKLSLKKGAVDIALNAPTWSEDGKTATVTLKDAKITEGEYTVTLSGVENIGEDSASFVGENEKVTKLEFATASDTIAQSTKARVQFRAVNQYGENVSLNAGSFTATTPGFSSHVTKDNAGAFVVNIDTTTMNGNPTHPGQTIIPVYIYENDSRISVSKNFQLGVAPFVQKMELGEPQYSGNKKSLSAVGDYVTIPVTLYDQYGNPVPFDHKSNWGQHVFTSPYTTAFEEAKFEDYDDDNFGELRIALKERVETSQDFTVTAQIDGGNASTKISVTSAKLATKIELGEPTDVFAEGDERDIYIPIIAYDADGNRLSADDIVDSQNLPRINITAQNLLGAYEGNTVETGISRASIEKFGPYKGYIHVIKVTGSANQYAYISAYLNSTTGNNSYITKTYPIQKARTPDKLTVVTNSAPKTLGGNTNLKVQVVDQNGKRLDRVSSNIVESGSSVTYRVYGVVNYTGNGNMSLQIKDRLDNVVQTVTKGQSFVITDFSDINGNNLTFNATGGQVGDVLELKLSLEKSKDGGATWTQVQNPITKKFEYVDAAKENLVYSVSKPASMYAALDPDVDLIPSSVKSTSSNNKYRKAIEVSVKDASGNTVVMPSNKRVLSVQSSVYSVAQVVQPGSNGTAYLHGVKPGKATITVIYEEFPKDGQTKGANVVETFDIEVKGEAPYVTSITSDSHVVIDAADISKYTYAYQLMNLSVKDQYGTNFTKGDIYTYDNITGVYYTVEGENAPSIDNKTGQISALTSGQSFTLRAYSNGQVATTFVRIR